jgi:hypothetical protein
MRTDGRTGKANLILAFRNFLKAPNNLTFNISAFSDVFRLPEHGGFLSLTHTDVPQNKCDRASSWWQIPATIL